MEHSLQTVLFLQTKEISRELNCNLIVTVWLCSCHSNGMRVMCCWSKNKTSSTASGELTITFNCFTTTFIALWRKASEVTQGGLPSELLYSEFSTSGQQKPDCSCLLVNLSFSGPAHYCMCYVGPEKPRSVHWVEKLPGVSVIISLKDTFKNLGVKMNWGYGVKMGKLCWDVVCTMGRKLL